MRPRPPWLAAAARMSCTWVSTSHGDIRPLPGATSKVAGGLAPCQLTGRRGYSNWSTTRGAGESISTSGSTWTILATDGVPSASHANTM